MLVIRTVEDNAITLVVVTVDVGKCDAKTKVICELEIIFSLYV